MKLLTTLFALLTVTLAIPAYGGSLTIAGYIRGGGGFYDATSYLGTATVLDAAGVGQAYGYTLGARGSTSYVRATAAFGRLGLSIGGSAYCYEPTCGVETSEGNYQVIVTDTLFMTGASSGFVRMGMSLHGGFGYQGYADEVGVFLDVRSTDPSQHGAQQTFVEYRNDAGESIDVNGTPLPVPADIPPDTLGGAMMQPFSFGRVYLTATLFGYYNCTSGINQSCAVSANFFGTALFGGAQVLDLDGNVIEGATLTSDSGYDYTQSIAPEPGSFGLLILAAPVLWALRRTRFGRTALPTVCSNPTSPRTR